MKGNNMSFAEIYLDAEECGYSCLSLNEMLVFIRDKYKISQEFDDSDWETLKDAWLEGSQALYNEEE